MFLGQLRFLMTSRYDVTTHIFSFICTNFSILPLHMAIQNRSKPSHFSVSLHAPLMLVGPKPTIRCKKGCYTWKMWKKRTFWLHTATKSIEPPSPPKQCWVWHIVRLSTRWFGSILMLINIFGLFTKCNITFATDCRNVINYHVQYRGLLRAKMKAWLLISHEYWMYINLKLLKLYLPWNYIFLCIPVT